MIQKKNSPRGRGIFTLSLSLVVLLSGCSRGPSVGWAGYAEGDYVYVSAPLSGRLDVVAVSTGENVQQGRPLFALESAAEKAAQDEAQARLANAQALAANTTKGRRSEELAQSQAQLRQTQAAVALAQADLARQKELQAQGFVAKAKVDDATTALKQAQAKEAEAMAALKVAQLPARADERAAAKANSDAAQSALAQANWKLQQKEQLAPTSGLVAEVFYRRGELVAAGQPVVALLPPENRKIRFYVPQDQLGTLSVGQAVQVSCDGCGTALIAKVSRLSPRAEYTPPVIYSNSQRAKLMFLAEARVAPSDAARLHPGQPLDVRNLTSSGVSGQ